MKKLVCVLALAGALVPAAAAEQDKLRVGIEHEGSIQRFVLLSGAPFVSSKLTRYVKDCTPAGELVQGEVRSGVTLNVQPLGETNEGTMFTLGLHIVDLVEIRKVQATPRCTIETPMTHSIDAEAVSVTLRPGEKKVLQLDPDRKPYTVTVERL